MKTKKFDCVEMKRKGSEHVFGAVAQLTKEEQLRFWQEGNEELRRIMAASKQKHKKVA
ncbi:MAG: hypothetical protein OEV28_04020 [Nitrospirota bacterium]|nr:hypothetical protein [Nitrospirota bacterium]